LAHAKEKYIDELIEIFPDIQGASAHRSRADPQGHLGIVKR